MKMAMKNRSHQYDINRPWRKHRHKYTKSKKCHVMTVYSATLKATFKAQFIKKN